MLALSQKFDQAAKRMDTLTPQDIRLQQPSLWQRTPPTPQSGPPISYARIFDDPTLSMGVFLLPKGAQIPLHDHPGMTVLSKILVGKLHVTSYDMPREPVLMGGSTKLYCDMATEKIVSGETPTLQLDPVHGNLHKFEALEDTAIFDILTPPYDDGQGRSCHYYEASTTPIDGKFELTEIMSPPPDLYIFTAPYDGPRVKYKNSVKLG